MEEELKIPYVDKRLIEHLKDMYSTNHTINVATNNTNSAEETLGFMKGVQEVISTLVAINIMQDGD